jgi:hypothetical protein
MAKVAPEIVINGLVKRGYSPHEAAGIAGNLAQESNFDTSIQEINPQTESARKQGGGFGLAQWTSKDRKQGLFNMAQVRGVPVDDLDLQLDYLDHELKTTHKKALKALKGTTNPRHAAFVFSKYYEAPSPKYANNAKRMSLAEQFVNMINPIGTAQADETPWQEPIDENVYLAKAKELGFIQDEPKQEPINENAYLEKAKELGFIQPEKRPGQKVADVVENIGGAVLEHAGAAGNTLLDLGDKYNQSISDTGNKIFGVKDTNVLASGYEDDKSDIAGLISGKEPMTARQKRQAALKNALVEQGYDPNAPESQVAGLVTDMGLGGAVGKAAGVVAKAVPYLSKLAPAIESFGMKGGNIAQKAAGGAIAGGASSALLDPETAGAGAIVGGALPVGVAGAAKGAKLAAKLFSGGAKNVLPEPTKAIAQKALQQGYVIPPTQAKPTLTNRLIEGTAGKLTTAQNASARNQEVSNKLAQKAIGAESLTDEGLAAVRQKANKAYDELAKSKPFVVDDAFKESLDKAAASTSKFKENFPGLKNSDIDNLVDSLKGKGQFDADSTIEAIKRLREDAANNRIALDASKKALGKAQSKIASSLEDLVERNLEKTGNKALLESYRGARQTLAKTHEVEKALDKATGNINANKLVGALQKGKPLSGELKDIAEFAQAFPKAAQNISKMGSLPQTSPLDVATVGTVSAMAGHPGYMALLALRPAARKLALSKMIQGGLAKEAAKAGSGKLAKGAASLALRSAPALIQQQTRQQ